jgi:hypothetical protein
MANLTSKQRSFVQFMQKSEEHARRGFEMLTGSADAALFFDELEHAGFFTATRSPAPVRGDEENSVRLPYWAAVDYLVSCAKAAGDLNDLGLAKKILAVVRNVSRYANNTQEGAANYHTYQKFSEVLGHLPLSAIRPSDIALTEGWLESKYDRGMVAHALAIGVLPRLIASPEPIHWKGACSIVLFCTKVRWTTEQEYPAHREPKSVVDDHWLEDMLKRCVAPLASKAGAQLARVFERRLSEVYGSGLRATNSWLFRPAVEDHPQNRAWGGIDNRLTEGLRDTVLCWVRASRTDAVEYVRRLLRSKIDICRRVAIYVIREEWSGLRGLYKTIVGPELFLDGHLHELYGLLSEHFGSLNVREQKATVRAITGIRTSATDKDAAQRLRRVQANWLSAIRGKGSAVADEAYASAAARAGLTDVGEHPDFHSYSESRWGPGPTPYEPPQIIELLRAGELISVLNAFETKDAWRGPTRRALTDAVAAAVVMAPDEFAKALPQFDAAQRAYQYAVIDGFTQYWEQCKTAKTEACASMWPALISFFERILIRKAFWNEPVEPSFDLEPTKDWIAPAIARLLASVNRRDDATYPDELLPRTWKLVDVLLQDSTGSTQLPADPMSTALNSLKGKSVDAFISHALRICRLNDKTHGAHALAWALIEPILNRELDACKDANFEFSTLVACHIPNFDFIESSWVTKNFPRLFNKSYAASFQAALDGLSYAPATRRIYQMLVATGALDEALRLESLSQKTRNRLLERVALAYLWSDEELHSLRLQHLFNLENVGDLEALVSFLSTVATGQLSAEQRERIANFWREGVDWALTQLPHTASLLSSLSRLITFVNSMAAEMDAVRIVRIAPYVHIGWHADDFVEQLLRLVETNDTAVARAFAEMLKSSVPTFDYEGKMRDLAEKLFARGKRAEAIALINTLRRLPGMEQLLVDFTQARDP